MGRAAGVMEAARGAAAPPEPDGILMEAVVRGDDAAFDTLVQRHMGRGLALAWRIVGHRQDAEDAVQEAFLAVLEGAATFDVSRPFGPWFARIVVNRALNARKRQARQPQLPARDDLVAGGAPTSAGVEERELQERVRDALQRLPERQRTVVQLSGFDGLTSAEIGEILGMPAGTVRYELHQARLALRRDLAACREAER
jgi:RNA polymerase sigma-70 factor, ECF subfamily